MTDMSRDEAREAVYGMHFSEFNVRHQAKIKGATAS